MCNHEAKRPAAARRARAGVFPAPWEAQAFAVAPKLSEQERGWTRGRARRAWTFTIYSLRSHRIGHPAKALRPSLAEWLGAAPNGRPHPFSHLNSAGGRQAPHFFISFEFKSAACEFAVA
jgi:hypothetical protein